MGLPIFIRCVATLWCCLVAEASRRLWVAYWHRYPYSYFYALWRGRTESNRTLPSDTCPRREEARRASLEKGSPKWGMHLVFSPSGPYATISLLSRPPTYLSSYSIRIRNHQRINYFASYFQVGRGVARSLSSIPGIASIIKALHPDNTCHFILGISVVYT